MTPSEKYLFIGDSLTEWFQFEKFLPHMDILNEGIAGETTYGLLERLEETLEKKAGRIFLMIGINDVFNGFPREDIIENLELIIEQIQTCINGTQLIVQSILPVNESMLGSEGYLNNTIAYINRELREHCDARGVAFLDLYPAFLSGSEMKKEYTTDGGHLSKAGYRLWAEKLQAFLDERNA
jgi:lysophospholipase L1-like esterase